MIVTLHLQDESVHISLSRNETLESCDRVKVRAGYSGIVFDERNKRESGSIPLAQGARLHIDAYGPEGEGHLLSQDYQRTETGLELVKTDWSYEGIQIVIT